MAINYEKLKNWHFPEVEHSYRAKDTILYALGVGFGADPMDRDQLRFVYEEGLEALPTMATVLAYPGQWAKNPETGIDWKHVVHGEQRVLLHKPLPVTAIVVGRTVIEDIIDKGAGKGALIYSRREVRDKETGELLASLGGTSFLRANGGFGGPSGPTRPVHQLPERAPDLVCDLATLPQAALIYRLSGDYNPLHADPEVAKAAGFPRPILHGLCSFGVAGHALLRTLCGYDPAKLKRVDGRFSSPVFPGETIRTEIWRDGGGRASFRCRVAGRDAVVINNGLAEFTA
jgi:acyl dehydratase